jgi:membrane protein
MKRYFNLFKQTFSEFGEDKAQRLGAALAYYTIFSLAPLLLIAIAIAGLVFGRDAAQGQIFGQLRGVLGPKSAEMVQEMVKSAAKPKSGTIATVVGIVTLLFGAAGVFGQLKDAMNTIWNVEPKKKGGIMTLIKDRFLSFAMVFGTGFLLLVSLVLDSAVAAAGHFVGDRLPGGEALWQGVQLIVSLGVVALLFALIFRFLPDVHPTWRDVWFGAIFTAVLFVGGKFGLGVYLGKSAVGSSYGAAGSLVVVLLWVYYSAQILFFGAEFTQVYARKHGSMAQAKEGTPEAGDAAPAPAPTPVVVIPPAPAGGMVKLAAGGAIGLFLGTLVGGFGAVLMVVKSVKKLFT